MKENHNYFSKLAFRLAENNLGKTKKNPSVGCIIVKNKSVISSGVTSVNGRPHAEFNALNKKVNFKDSDMYVTLEPCAHFGLTPPCTNIIKKKKIRNVYYSFNDPDLRTKGKAKKILKKVVKLNSNNNKYSDFYKSYYLNKKNSFPLIDAKIAISKDFFTISKKSRWITNSRSRQVSHLIRSRYDCIISTSDTINKDNSLLNCRIEGLNNFHPELIIIDRHLKINKKLKLFNITNRRKTYIVTTSFNKKKFAFLKRKKITIIRIKRLKNKNDFEIFFKKIFEIGKGRILIETGLVFLNELLKFNLINNFFIFRSYRLLKKNGSNNGDISLIKKIKLNNSVNVNLEKDHLFNIKLK